jgi:hypothetical protein
MLALRNRIGVASKFSCEIAEFEWIEGLFRLLTQGSSLFSVRDYDGARVVIDEFEVFGAAFEGEAKKGRRGSPIVWRRRGRGLRGTFRRRNLLPSERLY